MKNIKFAIALFLSSLSLTALAESQDLLITLEAFSGLENPTMSLSIEQAEKLGLPINDLIAAYKSKRLEKSRYEPMKKGILGYQGITISDPSGVLLPKDAVLRLKKDVVFYNQGIKKETYVNEQGSLEKRLLDKMHKDGLVSKRLMMRMKYEM